MSNGCEKKNENMNLDLYYKELGLEKHYVDMEEYKDHLSLKQEFEKKEYFVTTGQIHAFKVAEFIAFCNTVKKKDQ